MGCGLKCKNFKNRHLPKYGLYGLGAPAPRAQPPGPHRGAPPLLHTATFDPARPPQPHRASPPPRRLLCHLSSAIAIASMIAAASFPPPPLPPPPSPRLASTTPYSPRLHHTLLARAAAALAPAALTAVH